MDFTKGLGSNVEEGGSFIKIEPGQNVTGVLAGDPMVFYNHFINNSFHPCTDENCQHCKNGIKKAFKFKINMIVHENHALVPKIFQGGWKVYQQLGALQQAGYDLNITPVTIGRQGSGKNSVYAVMPSPKGQLAPNVQAQFKAVKLLALQNQVKTPPKEEPHHSGAEMNDANEDLPF